MIRRWLFAVFLIVLLFVSLASAEGEPVLVLDYKAFSVGFQGLTIDEYYGNTLHFSFTNQSTESLMVSIDYLLMDGVLVETFFADLVEPGQTSAQQVVVESAARYMSDWELTEVVADLWVYSAENLYDADVYHGEVTFLPQGKAHIKPWVRQEKPSDIQVLDNFLVRMDVINASKGTGSDVCLYLYTRGKTERNLTVRIQKVWINDTPIEVYYAGRLIRNSSVFSTLDVPGGLDLMLNIPGQNRIRMTIEYIERDGQKARTLKRENVSFTM